MPVLIKRRGFTLAEVIVVMVITAVLASATVYTLVSQHQEQKRLAWRKEVGKLEDALRLHYQMYGGYPVFTSVQPAPNTFEEILPGHNSFNPDEKPKIIVATATGAMGGGSLSESVRVVLSKPPFPITPSTTNGLSPAIWRVDMGSVVGNFAPIQDIPGVKNEFEKERLTEYGVEYYESIVFGKGGTGKGLPSRPGRP